jgi:hypothetical protein
VAFGDLPGQHQADAGAAGLGGEEGHEQVVAAGQAQALVEHFDQHLAALAAGAQLDPPAGQAGLGGVLDQVDQRLLQLVGIGGERISGRARPSVTGTRCSRRPPAQQRRQLDSRRCGGGRRASACSRS